MAPMNDAPPVLPPIPLGISIAVAGDPSSPYIRYDSWPDLNPMGRALLTAAAESLRVASERLCDYVKATMDEAGATAMARGDTPATQHGVGDPPREPCATSPSPTPPAIPLGAVVEVEGERGVESWRWGGASWISGYGGVAILWRALILTALYHARREREEARDGFRLRGDTIEGLRRDLADARKARDHFRTEYHQGSVALDAICRMIETEDGYSACQTAVENVREVVNRLAVYAFEREAERDAARRELAAALAVGAAMRKDAKRYFAKATENYERAANAERERDEKRAKAWEFDRIQRACPAGVDAFDYLMLLELAAAKDQGLGATARTSREAPNSEESDCERAVASPAPVSAPSADPCRVLTSTAWDWPAAKVTHTHTSPNADTPHADVVSETAPLSGAGNTGEMGKPRRWWLVVDHNGTAKSVETSEAYAEWFAQYYGLANNIRYTVVPVIEARVTRETVERVAESLFRASEGSKYQVENTIMRAQRMDQARAALSALGLTVEGDDNG